MLREIDTAFTLRWQASQMRFTYCNDDHSEGLQEAMGFAASCYESMAEAMERHDWPGVNEAMESLEGYCLAV